MRGFKLRAFRDGEPIPLPDSAARAFAGRETASVTIGVSSGAVTANCHFFGGDLELDVDPHEVLTAEAFGSVLAIMRCVSAATRLPIFAVMEGCLLTEAFLRVSPDGEAAFLGN